MRKIDLTGKRYGRLSVIKESDQSGKWICKCICGNECVVFGNNLRRLHTISCGCALSDVLLERNTTHGLRKHPAYQTWRYMMERCYYPKSTRYKNYGGRGVMVCEEWKNPEVFIKWALENGWQKHLQLDKDIIPKKLNIPALLYCPDYCQFVTAKENVRANSNTKLTTKKANEIRNSKDKTISLMAKYGVGKTTINNIRSNRSWV